MWLWQNFSARIPALVRSSGQTFACKRENFTSGVDTLKKIGRERTDEEDKVSYQLSTSKGALEMQPPRRPSRSLRLLVMNLQATPSTKYKLIRLRLLIDLHSRGSSRAKVYVEDLPCYREDRGHSFHSNCTPDGNKITPPDERSTLRAERTTQRSSSSAAVSIISTCT